MKLAEAGLHAEARGAGRSEYDLVRGTCFEYWEAGFRSSKPTARARGAMQSAVERAQRSFAQRRTFSDGKKRPVRTVMGAMCTEAPSGIELVK